MAGTVRHKGQTVTSGQVSFLGADGKPVCADIQPDGTYQAKKVPVGEAIITVVRYDDTAQRGPVEKPKEWETAPFIDPKTQYDLFAPKNLLPDLYSDPATTPLRFKVQGGSNAHDIKLD